MIHYLITALISFVISIIVFVIKDLYLDYKNKKMLACALVAEIESLLNQFESVGGSSLFEYTMYTRDDKMVIKSAFMEVGNGFFVVYEHNADKLGLFDEKLVSDIVELYTNLQGFVNTIKTWNSLSLKKEKDSVSIEEMKRYSQNSMKQLSKLKTQIKDVTTRLQGMYSETSQ